MCAPRVTRHTSIQYSSSCHTRVNVGASIFFTATIIRTFQTLMLTRVWLELEYHINVRRVTCGAHIEHL
jgi:hypothetical protein